MPHDWTFIIALTAIVCGTGLVALFICLIFISSTRRHKKRASRDLSEDEGQMLEEVWDGIQKMETRIENLETILLSKEKIRSYEKTT